MKKVRVKLNRGGVRELLRSEEMLKECERHARRVASVSGAGYEVSEYTGRNRVNVSIYAESDEAKRDNRKNNTLLKVVSNL